MNTYVTSKVKFIILNYRTTNYHCLKLNVYFKNHLDIFYLFIFQRPHFHCKNNKEETFKDANQMASFDFFY